MGATGMTLASASRSVRRLDWVTTRCRDRRASHAPGPEDPRAGRDARPPRRPAARRCCRRGPPIRRRGRARPSRTLVACEEAAACCTGYTTTRRRRVPAIASASSHVRWTTELRSPASLLTISASHVYPRSTGQTHRCCRNFAKCHKSAAGKLPANVSGGAMHPLYMRPVYGRPHEPAPVLVVRAQAPKR